MKNNYLAVLACVLMFSNSQAQTHFQPVDPTEPDGNIVLVSAATFEGEPLSPGDEIAVFSVGILVGVSVVVEFPLTITTYPEGETPGYTVETPLQFRIWRSLAGQEHIADASYNNGTGVFSDDNAVHDIDLEAYNLYARQWTFYPEWRHIYLNIEPEDFNSFSVFSTLDHLSLVNANDGAMYLPPFINTIGNVEVGEGFSVSVTAPDVMTVWGFPVDVDSSQRIFFRGGVWNLFSFNVIPETPNIAGIFADEENLVIVQDNDGNVYIPNEVNTIGEINVLNGYRAIFDNYSVVDIDGFELHDQLVFELQSNRWEWLGCTLPTREDPQIALMELRHSLQIVMSDRGQFWIPGVVSTLDQMRPGDAYILVVNENVDFRYREITKNAITDDFDPYIEPQLLQTPVSVTGIPYILLVQHGEGLLQSGAEEIKIYDSEKLVGAARIEKAMPFTPVTCWQNDTYTGEAGFTPGNSINIIVEDHEGNPIESILESDHYFGETVYSDITLSALNKSIPQEFEVLEPYPNPFNSSTNIVFTLPRTGDVELQLINILGQALYTSNEIYSAGTQKISLSSDQFNFEMSSGLYFVRLNYENQTRMKKVVLVE
ncbi:T9SS type A sorting domain-containing protein [bacterium]|nr:T9SS type A sorting domain-containing protein [bacterium]